MILCAGTKNFRGNKNIPSIIFIALHKPIDYAVDAEHERSVFTLLKKENSVGKNRRDSVEPMYPIDRLDTDAEGLVLFASEKTGTRQFVAAVQEYEITIDRPLEKKAKDVLEHGMLIDGTYRSGMRVLRALNKGKRAIVTIQVGEDRGQHMRTMLTRLGYGIASIKRTRIGNIKLGTLPVGKWRFIGEKEM